MKAVMLMVVGCALGVEPALSAPPSGTLKPVVTLVLRDPGEVARDVEALDKLGEQPMEVGRLFAAATSWAVGNETGAAVDWERPWILCVRTDGVRMLAYACLPCIGTGEPQSDKEVTIKEVDGWMFISRQKDALVDLPDPTGQLERFPFQGNREVVGEIHMRNIPAPLRRMLTTRLALGAKIWLNTVTPDLAMPDKILFGITLDRRSSTAELDIRLMTQPGNAATVAHSVDITHRDVMRGVGTAGIGVSGKPGDAVVDHIVDLLWRMKNETIAVFKARGLSPRECDYAARAWDDIIDTARKIKRRHFDGGAALVLDPTATLLVGGNFGSGKLEVAAQELVRCAQRARLGAGAILLPVIDPEESGYRIYALDVPTHGTAKRFFGDNVEIALGVSDQATYLGIGGNAVRQVKYVFRQIGLGKHYEGGPGACGVITATPLAGFIASATDDPDIAGMAVEATRILERYTGKDRITFIVDPILGGTRVEMKVEQGILAALATIGSR